MLFKKLAACTDIHFGDKNDSEQHNEDCLDFIDWFCAKVIEHQCDAICVLGDYKDNSKFTNNLTEDYSKRGIEKLAALGLPIYWIIGNHDLYFKHSRRVHSLPYLDKFPNITVINEVTRLGDADGDVMFAPWLLGDEYALLLQEPAKYIFGHFELPLFLLNAMIECPDRGGLTADHFTDVEMVFSGHFHKRQMKLNAHGIPVIYIGNAFGHDFNDVADRDRGMMILPWGEEPGFLDWEEGPNFHRINLSDVIDLIENDGLESTFNARSVVECFDDVNIGVEGSLVIKEAMQGVVRRFTLIQTDHDVDISSGDIDLASDTETVDVIVKRNLMNIDTSGGRYKTDLLVSLYEEADEV